MVVIGFKSIKMGCVHWKYGGCAGLMANCGDPRVLFQP